MIRVEARDWARLPRRFHRAIEREYVVVVGGDPAISGDDVEQQGDRSARKRDHERARNPRPIRCLAFVGDRDGYVIGVRLMASG